MNSAVVWTFMDAFVVLGKTCICYDLIFLVSVWSRCINFELTDRIPTGGSLWKPHEYENYENCLTCSDNTGI